MRWQEGKFLVHTHDWQALFLCLHSKILAFLRLKPEKIVFTIHNLAYQGIGRGDYTVLINLPVSFLLMNIWNFMVI